jgi:hypothetical protein
METGGRSSGPAERIGTGLFHFLWRIVNVVSPAAFLDPRVLTLYVDAL